MRTRIPHFLPLKKRLHETISNLTTIIRRALILVFLIVFSATPFFSERKISQSQMPRNLPDPAPDPTHSEHRVHLINLFLTPSFLFHLFWITGLGIFSVALLLNIVTKILLVTCSEGVKYMIPESLPTKSVFSR